MVREKGTDSFRRYQRQFSVGAQRPQETMASIGERKAFVTKPDISLMRGRRVSFILDTKWKRIDAGRDHPRHGIDQGDLYQLYAYGRRYGCQAVALVYPQNRTFRYQFFDGLPLLAAPFDVTRPQAATEKIIRMLEAPLDRSEA